MKKRVHYTDGSGATSCGKGTATTTDTRLVTCRMCPTTLRWNMWVHGLTYSDAAILTTAARRMESHPTATATTMNTNQGESHVART